MLAYFRINFVFDLRKLGETALRRLFVLILYKRLATAATPSRTCDDVFKDSSVHRHSVENSQALRTQWVLCGGANFKTHPSLALTGEREFMSDSRPGFTL